MHSSHNFEVAKKRKNKRKDKMELTAVVWKILGGPPRILNRQCY